MCECLLISSDGTAEGRDNGTALCVQLNGSDQRWGEILTRVECMRERESVVTFEISGREF